MLRSIAFRNFGQSGWTNKQVGWQDQRSCRNNAQHKVEVEHVFESIPWPSWRSNSHWPVFPHFPHQFWNTIRENYSIWTWIAWVFCMLNWRDQENLEAILFPLVFKRVNIINLQNLIELDSSVFFSFCISRKSTIFWLLRYLIVDIMHWSSWLYFYILNEYHVRSVLDRENWKWLSVENHFPFSFLMRILKSETQHSKSL